MRLAGIRPELIYAYEKTGLILMEPVEIGGKLGEEGPVFIGQRQQAKLSGFVVQNANRVGPSASTFSGRWCHVGLMLRDSMLETGEGATDILTFGEDVKKYFHGRTAEGSTDRELNDAADRFFSAIASDIGSQDSQ